MRPGRIGYRIRQFLLALNAVPDPDDLAQASLYLTSDQGKLFSMMQLSEQAHSLQVFKHLLIQTEREPVDCGADLLVAALLHDVGKTRYPLRLSERVLVVLVKAFLPSRFKRWGKLPVSASQRGHPGGLGWKRPFIVAEQHPEWGSQMAAAVGVSPLAVSLIRRHQEPPNPGSQDLVDRLLLRLQSVDSNY